MATKYIHPYDSQQVEAFLKHYRSQFGSGGFPVFRGDRYQTGAGLGNILASIGRFLLPIVAPAAQRFIGETLRGHRQGKSIKESAKEAFSPALTTALGATSKQIGKQIMAKNQKGGRRRRRKSVALAKTHKKRGKGRKRVYKGMIGSGRKRKAYRKKSKSSRRRTKRVRYLNPSFANF